ncbi:HIT zinc finger protein, partial [Trifolium pratense]
SCSLPCFKKHKELPCVNPTSSEVKTTVLESVVEKPSVIDNAMLEALVANPLAVDKKDVLEQSQLEALASSSEIRDALNDKALQELICGIACSPNAENELDKAMAEEAFQMFTDKVMFSPESHMDSLPLHVELYRVV